MTDAPPFSVVALDGHDRSRFDCGSIALNTYLQMQAGQDMKRRVAASFVAVDRSTGDIAGFYTLSAGHVHLSDLGTDLQRKLPRYPVVPAVRLGRLAIAVGYQGRKLGAALLASAVSRAVRSEIAVAMMLVDAKDDRAAAFYVHHGFRPDPGNPLCLFAPLATLAQALGHP